MTTDNKISIDKVKCTGCGICIEECPTGVLEITSGKSVLKDSQFCISCGHCAMVCPEIAIKSYGENKRYFDVCEFSEEGEAVRLLEGKRSARVFKDQKISPEEVAQIISYGEMAPSASNKRIRKYIVLNSQQEIDSCIQSVVDAYKPLLKLLSPFILKLMAVFNKSKAAELRHLKTSVGRVMGQSEGGNDRIFRGSSCVIIVTGPTKELFSKDDSIAAQHYMMLYAESKGISSFIAGYAQWAHKKLEKKLNIDKDYSIYAISAFGYNKYKYKRSVRFEAAIDWR